MDVQGRAMSTGANSHVAHLTQKCKCKFKLQTLFKVKIFTFCNKYGSEVKIL